MKHEKCEKCENTTAPWRIGQVASYLFRRWFGRAPDRSFLVWSGNAASARDRRGNCITLEQRHWPSKALVRQPPLPLVRYDLTAAPVEPTPEQFGLAGAIELALAKIEKAKVMA